MGSLPLMHRLKITPLVLLLTILIALAGASPAVGTTVTPTGTFTGKIEETWLKNGGAATLGDPFGVEHKTPDVQGKNVYTAETTEGVTIHWDGSQGGKVWFPTKTPSLSGVDNERVPLGLVGVWRTARLCYSAASADRLLTSHLWDRGLIIDLRNSGTSSCPDPSIKGATRVNYPIASHADYPRYVTGSSERGGFSKALKRIAARPTGPDGKPTHVLVHCRAGEDRTGWLIAMMQYAILGPEHGVIDEEYLRGGTNMDPERLRAGLDKVAEVFGTEDGWNGVYEYLTDPVKGLGLTEADLAGLRRYAT